MHKYYNPDFKSELVREVKKGERTISQIAADRGVSPNQLYRWCQQAEARARRKIAAVSTHHDSAVGAVPHQTHQVTNLSVKVG